MMVRFEEGRYNGVIVRIHDFRFQDDNASDLIFNYNVVFNPYKKELPLQHINRVVKVVAKKLLDLAIKNAMEMGMLDPVKGAVADNDSRTPDLKKSGK